MDRKHCINKPGWEAMTTLSLAVAAASLVGMRLTQQVSVKLTVLVISKFPSWTAFIAAA